MYALLEVTVGPVLIGMITYPHHLAIPSTNAFAGSALRNHQVENKTLHHNVRFTRGNCETSAYWYDQVSSPSRDRVNQRVCIEEAH